MERLSFVPFAYGAKGTPICGSASLGARTGVLRWALLWLGGELPREPLGHKAGGDLCKGSEGG